MKEASPKGPHIIWLHWYEMSSVDKSIEIETESILVVCLWLGKMGGLGCSGFGVWSFLGGN